MTLGPPSCLTNWGHGGKFFLQRITLERTLQPILCATHPADRCGDSQTLHLLEESSGRKAGMENCPRHIRLLWVEARAAATTTTFHQHLHFLLLKDSRGRKAKVVKGTTQQKQTKKLWGFLRAQVPTLALHTHHAARLPSSPTQQGFVFLLFLPCSVFLFSLSSQDSGEITPNQGSSEPYTQKPSTWPRQDFC